jgi:uncharacterized protein (DUF983 family)
MDPEVSTLRAILNQLCPRCRLARMFQGSILQVYRLRWPKMHQHCPVCRLKFEREPGYFLGAMYISYGMALLAVPAIGVPLWLITEWGLIPVTIWAAILTLPLAPAITLFARVLWLYLDLAVDPEPFR